MTFRVFVPIKGMQEIVNDPEPHSAHTHSYVRECDYLSLQARLDRAAKYVDHLAHCDKRRIQIMPMVIGRIYTDADNAAWQASLRCTCGLECSAPTVQAEHP